MSFRRILQPTLPAVLALLAACSGAVGPLPCTKDDECPTGAYCKPAVGGAARTCDVAPSSCAAPKPDLCHGACLDLKTDLANCGSCDNACPTPSGSNPTCAGGACGFNCTSATAVKVGQTCLDKPGVPAPLSATGGDRVVHLSWTAGQGSTSTAIRRTPVAGGSTVVVVTAATSTSYDDATVTAGTAWSYVFRAANAAGESADSAALTALTVPAAPANASFAAPVLSGATAQAVLSWDSVPGATSYTIVRSGTPSETGTAADAGASRTSYTTRSLAAGSVYSFTISASNASGPGPTTANLPLQVPPPASPSFTAPTVSATQVALAWTAAPSATGYKLYKGATSATAATLLQVVTPPAALSYTDTAVTTNAPVGYQLVSTNPGGDGGAATLDLFVPPSAPAGLTAVANLYAIALTWNQVAGVTSYDVIEGTTSQCSIGAGCAVVVSVPQPASGATAATMLSARNAATQYFYRVVARTVVGSGSAQSAPSGEASATTAPAAPTGLTALADPNQPTITVSWNRTPAAQSYDLVETRVDNNATSTVGVSDPPSGSSVQAVRSGLQPGTQYTYTVAARNAAGASAPAGGASATTAGLQPPANLKVTSTTATSITLGWSAVTSAAAYLVLRGGSPGTEIQIAQDVASPSYVDASVSPGSSYSYLVAAQKSVGDTTHLGGKSQLSVTLPPATPQQFKLAGVTSSSVSLSWSPSAGATAYVLGVGTAAGAESPLPDIPDTGSTISTTVPNLQPGVAYYLNVLAKNGGGSSPLSAELSTVTLLPAPASLSATTFSDVAVDLSWPRVAGAAQYEAFHCSGNCASTGSFTSIGKFADTGATPVTARDAGLMPNATYTFQVVAQTAAAASPASPQATALTQLSVPTGITVTQPGDNLLQITFNSVPGATTYDLWRNFGPGAYSYQPGNPPTSASSTSIDDAPIAPGIPILYSVVARSPNNTSARSPEVSGTDHIGAAPAFSLGVSGGSIRATIQRSPGFDLYDVALQTSAAAPCNVLTTVTEPQAQTVIANLSPNPPAAPGSQFFVCVRARTSANGVDVTPWSAPLLIAFPSQAAIAPLSFTATGAHQGTYQGVNRGGMVLLSWQAANTGGGAPSSYTVTRTSDAATFTTTNTWYTDLLPNGTPGQTLIYTVTAANSCNATPPPSGCMPATGSATTNPVSLTLDPATFSGSKVLNYVTPTADVQVPTKLIGLTNLTPVDATGRLLPQVQPVKNNDGYFVFPQSALAGAVRGYFRSGNNVTDVSMPGWIDLQSDITGRPDVNGGFFEATTNMKVSASNLSPYQSTDVLEVYSPYSNTYGYDLVHSGYALAAVPSPGDTVLNNFFIDWYWAGFNLVNGSKGDVFVVTQVSTTQVSSKGLPYNAVVRLAPAPSFTMLGGRTTALNLAFNTLTPSKSVNVLLKRSAFAQHLAEVNPTAKLQGVQVNLDTFPGGQAHGNYAGGIDMLFAAANDTSTADVDFGSVAYADPFDSAWYRRGNVFGTAQVVIPVPGFANPATLALGGSMSSSEPLATFLTEAPAGLAPHLTPVLAPKITYLDATGASHTIDFFTPQAQLPPSLGTTVTVSWSPPAVGTPNYYRVRFSAAFDPGTGTPVIGGGVSMLTTGTSVTTPPGVLVVNAANPNRYAIIISASADPGHDLVHYPVGKQGQATAVAQCVTSGTITP